MRRPTTVLILVVVVVVALALFLRSRGEESAPDATTTTEAGDESTTTSGAATSSTNAASTSTTSIPELPPGTDVCSIYGAITVAGTVQAPDLVEASGLAASRTTPNVLWSHNDSRGDPVLFAIGTSGADLGAHAVPDAFSLDWEDIGVGPDHEGQGSYVYVGDMGDNFGIRGGLITVWRVPDVDPAQLNGEFPESLPIALVMPNGPYDAEALFIDPVDPALYVITKSRSEAFVFRGPLTQATEPHEMELVTTLFLGAEVSGADISADGSVIALRGYNDVWMWSRPPGTTIGEAFAAEPCSAPSPEERQGESIALTADWSYFTVSEGSNPDLHQVPSGL